MKLRESLTMPSVEARLHNLVFLFEFTAFLCIFISSNDLVGDSDTSRAAVWLIHSFSTIYKESHNSSTCSGACHNIFLYVNSWPGGFVHMLLWFLFMHIYLKLSLLWGSIFIEWHVFQGCKCNQTTVDVGILVLSRSHNLLYGHPWSDWPENFH